MTEERIAKAILTFYNEENSIEGTKLLTVIRRTVMQKCRRIFDRCSKLLFPEGKKKGKKIKKYDKEGADDEEDEEGVRVKKDDDTEKINVTETDIEGIRTSKETIKKQKTICDKNDGNNESENFETETASPNNYPFQQLIHDLSSIIITIFILNI